MDITHRRHTGSLWSHLAALSLLLFSALAAEHVFAQGAPKPDWSPADMESQEGRIFVMTGGTSGIGYESAKALAAKGARVVIAARKVEQGKDAIASIRRELPNARVEFEAFDLADLA